MTKEQKIDFKGAKLRSLERNSEIINNAISDISRMTTHPNNTEYGLTAYEKGHVLEGLKRIQNRVNLALFDE